VRTVADDATNALNDFSEQITAYAADPESADQTAVTDSASAVQAAMTKVGATCP
jgi:cytochrome c556